MKHGQYYCEKRPIDQGRRIQSPETDTVKYGWLILWKSTVVKKKKEKEQSFKQTVLKQLGTYRYAPKTKT